jgi:hypothetical protein
MFTYGVCDVYVQFTNIWILLDFELLCELALCIENEQPTVHLHDATMCSDVSAKGLEVNATRPSRDRK